MKSKVGVIDEFVSTIRRNLSELEPYEEAAIRRVLEQCYDAGFLESLQILEKREISDFDD